MRLRPPQWRAPAGSCATSAGWPLTTGAAGREAARLLGRLIAHDLREVGIDVDCAPVLDVAARRHDRGHRQPLLRGRARPCGRACAGAFAEGLLAGGVAPVIKHLPGHGRAVVDSHLELPRGRGVPGGAASTPISRRSRALRGLPFAMTAHVVYPALDPEPAGDDLAAR